MPSNNPSPRPAFAAEVNLRDFSGVEVFKRNTTNTTTIATFTSSQGRYEDWLDFLSGRGSGRDLQDDLDSVATMPSTISIGINSSDRFYIECARHNFSITANDGFFGFTAAGQGPAGSGPPYRLTATSEWTRGTYTLSTIGITPTTSGGHFAIPEFPQMAQSAITLLRDRGNEGDADDTANTLTLEGIDNAENDILNQRFRWFIDVDGYVVWSCDATENDASVGVTWVDTDFRDLLGFSGNETLLNTGSLSWQVNYQKADYPAPMFITPTRPVERITRTAERVGSAVRLTSGQVVGHNIGTYQSIEVDWWIDGPVDEIDLHRHWLERVVPYMTKGQRVSFYGEWGDPRRGLISYGVTASQDAYDRLYTTEKDGERGRYRGRVSMNSSESETVSWPGRERRRAPVTITLQKAED